MLSDVALMIKPFPLIRVNAALLFPEAIRDDPHPDTCMQLHQNPVPFARALRKCLEGICSMRDDRRDV